MHDIAHCGIAEESSIGQIILNLMTKIWPTILAIDSANGVLFLEH